MNRKTVECIYGNPDLTPKHVEILQKYFKVDWQFAKSDFIYYIEPVTGIAMCKSASILYSETSKYQFACARNHLLLIQGTFEQKL